MLAVSSDQVDQQTWHEELFEDDNRRGPVAFAGLLQAPLLQRAALRRNPVQPAAPTGSPVLMATSNMVRNLVLPKLAMMDDIALAGLADNPGNALKMLVQEHPEIVILDMDFGGPFVGLDTARMMQKTRVRAAIAMLVPELDPEALRKQARKFGSSWSYVKKTTAGRVDILETVLKSAVRGVQWVEPDLSRSLAVLWKIAEQARELENRHIDIDPSTFASSKSLKARKFSEPQTDAAPGEDESDPEWDEDDVALGIKTMSTSGPDTGGVNITSVSVGHGDVGQNVGKVRRNRRTG